LKEFAGFLPLHSWRVQGHYRYLGLQHHFTDLEATRQAGKGDIERRRLI